MKTSFFGDYGLLSSEKGDGRRKKKVRSSAGVSNVEDKVRLLEAEGLVVGRDGYLLEMGLHDLWRG